MAEWNRGYWEEENGEEEEADFCDRECYVFNERLKKQFDDDCCEHCSKYLTIQCEYLEDFMEKISDLGDFD
ncbi:MAG: hypothetical protein JSW28_01975 [Thermoplasmata archaeon]|nr:MAG: hypothetical protein JSW28_01975 [Thermoplasmata archaeon]